MIQIWRSQQKGLQDVESQQTNPPTLEIGMLQVPSDSQVGQAMIYVHSICIYLEFRKNVPVKVKEIWAL
jgi:hypothetical protein